MSEREQQQAQPSLEENFETLEGLLEILSDEEVSLEDAFSAYSKGIAVLKECNDQLDQVEKKVLVLSRQGTLEALDEEQE